MRRMPYQNNGFASMLVATALMAASAAAKAEPFEVLGIQLGAPVDTVDGALKLEGATAVTYRRALSMGSFTMPEMIFGEDLSNGSPQNAFAATMYAADKEYLRLVFDLRTRQKVDYIKRVRVFSKDTNPGFDNLKASLIAKYGDPVSFDMNNGAPIFLWSRDSQIVHSKQNALSFTCVHSLIEMWPLAQAQYNGSAIQNKDLPRCGSWLRAQLSLASYNPSLVAKITIDAGDLAGLSGSYAYLMDQLRTGAAGAAAGQADRAKQNKAPL